ncbi:acyltransferase [Erythrobacter arachoides]|uniref:Acyltransferase n=2 Tax=Aurantiacibacter arachoides TaxID=1850444 RepID=A0A844ZYP3_9SPHN|nr:acyltransferase [Aurantiacibacter arachoides]
MRLEGRAPSVPKFVFIGAPHTSNWDFIAFAGVVNHFKIAPSFLGKHTLFRWPMTRFMRDMGGIPVVRSRSGGYVQSVIDAFDKADTLALVVAPEGSRTSSGEWRTGFYHIAHGAGVPIVPAYVDYDRKVCGIGEPIMPTGDYRADLAKIAAFYRRVMPDCQRFVALEAMTRTLDEMAG